MAGRLLVSPALEIAQYDRAFVVVGQAFDLLVQHPLEAIARLDRLDSLGPKESRGPFVRLPPQLGRSIMARCPNCGLVQPGGQRVARPERVRLVGQGEERRLKSVVGLVLVAQYCPANAVDKRPVPLDQGCEGQLARFAQPGRKPLQQLTVGQGAEHPHVEEDAQVLQRRAALLDRHGTSPWSVHRHCE